MSQPTRGVKPTAGVPVVLRELSLKIGDRVLLSRAAAHFDPGQVTLIVGPSGAGKSTLLRALAGLTSCGDRDSGMTGEIEFNGTPLSDSERRRAVGIVFQNFALLDELSPLDNVRLAAAHRRRVPSESNGAAAPRDLLHELGVPKEVRTASLSGGQRQRLAIARTLAYDPDVVLYDEPTSGLDAATAAEVAALIRSTHATHPKTSIVVTHDYESLAPIADRIYLLDPQTCRLREIQLDQWQQLRDQLKPAHTQAGESEFEGSDRLVSRLRRIAVGKVADFFALTSRMAEQTLLLPLRLLPLW